MITKLHKKTHVHLNFLSVACVQNSKHGDSYAKAYGYILYKTKCAQLIELFTVKFLPFKLFVIQNLS